MLSFKKYKNSKAVARVKGGINNNKIIYISDEAPTIDNNYKQKLKDEMLFKIMDKFGIDKDDLDRFEDFENEIFDIVDNNNKIKDIKTEIEIIDGDIVPYFETEIDQTKVYYLCGSRGSGKSTMCKNIMECYNKLFPKNKIIVFSKKIIDEAFNGLKNIYRVPIDENLLNEPIDINAELSNSLCVFDDIKNFHDKHIQEYIRTLRDRCIEDGRSLGIYVCATNHLLLDGEKQKQPLHESDVVVFFRKGGCLNHLEAFAKKYLGYNRKKFDSLIEDRSRYICISKDVPQCIIKQHKIYIP